MMKSIAIAGIIGGIGTEITSETKNIFLEVAYFTPENIRKTGRRLGISTDSSYRNERGIDIEGIPDASERAMALIAEIANGEILDGAIDKYIEKPQKYEIPLSLEKLNKIYRKRNFLQM